MLHHNFTTHRLWPCFTFFSLLAPIPIPSIHPTTCHCHLGQFRLPQRSSGRHKRALVTPLHPPTNSKLVVEPTSRARSCHCGVLAQFVL
ncbi:unnamed protein product [Protopolystoma xenopodis]|uniref:Secreted protein n=1 Tax=Protopolystoma xenopodis TaxID=117903 RepID=A0A3S5AA29_9PLAT|nr:unnamed protein product [Protopolystoma xenopodis]